MHRAPLGDLEAKLQQQAARLVITAVHCPTTNELGR